jgi:hypothetical protein
MNLQVAQDKLQGIGLFVLDQEDATGQGRLQINDDNWTVCRQQPPAGDTVNPTDQITVWSVKDGELCDAEAQPAATDSTAPAQGSAGSTDDAPTPVDVTVDQLVDMINAGGPGRPGDRFHFTGTLVGRDHWYVGVTGEYSVLVETTQGSDLLVFIDKSETATWRDGMRVDMIVENVEREINGETEAGWIKAVSATIVG